ncbi:Holliday junction resolvase RuvX [Plebeiibacterium marinum]|uniref:Putative pre-16S rRNA nuclease n=1 Tax=Plebeiibacterium marinum TaxID=2992111 RepID=A0AAE3MBP4_9BACT|nr:Holliday junction resolvase RuvX [Plebeiobacterium marinum]MCW3804182.1 Holliday junction resolvase RuvX [Plebeiobacterium marinum]
MGRILAIDYGRKKSGIAVTDPLQIVANGLDTVPSHTLIDFLEKYFASEDVELIVLGYPKQVSGEESESMKYIKPFYNRLRNKFPHLNVEWVDERFTSKIAFQAMIDGGLKKKARQDKALVDKISATIILQTYLEQKRDFKI